MATNAGKTYQPVLASPLRRVLHTLIALAGWVLFGYWWWLVARRANQHEIRFTLMLIAVALVVIVLVTIAWAIHNVRIFRSRGARKSVRESLGDPLHDAIGRPVKLPAAPDTCRTAAIVRVRVEAGTKLYVAVPAGGAPGPAPGPGATP